MKSNLLSLQDMNISLETFEQAIRKARCRETSADPEGRTPDNPSHMHCFTTAVLLYETLGFPAYVEKLFFDSGEFAPHCYNRGHDQQEIRMTEEQVERYIVTKRYPKFQLTDDNIEFVFSVSPEIKEKYDMLKQRFQTEIKKIIK